MKATLTLDDDVVSLLEQMSRGAGFQELGNELLRSGFGSMGLRRSRMQRDPEGDTYTRPHHPGRCLLDNLDHVAGVLAHAEGEDFR